MKKLLKNKTGSVSVIFIGLLFVLMLIAFYIMEQGGVYLNDYDAETILQRSCNSAVEGNMSDVHRADHILYLEVEEAIADFYDYLAADLPDKYSVTIDSIAGTATPPSLSITGTITFPTFFSQYGIKDVSIKFAVASTNYRTE